MQLVLGFNSILVMLYDLASLLIDVILFWCIYRPGIEVAYLLRYVNDIVLIASSTALLQRVIPFSH